MNPDDRLSGRVLRLEAAEALARAVAHELNNALGAIITYTEFAQAETTQNPQVQEDLAEVRRASDRCAALTRRLVALSKVQRPKNEAFDIKSSVEDLEKVLRRLLADKIELEIVVEAGEYPLETGRDSFETLLLNLALEALLRMPGGGRLRLEIGLLPDEGGAALLGCHFHREPSAEQPVVVREEAWGIDRVREVVALAGWMLSTDDDDSLRIEFQLSHEVVAL